MKYYFIWSFRNRAWWRIHRSGYANWLTDAGLYSYDEAAEITIRGGLPGGNLAVERTLAVSNFQALNAEQVEAILGTWARL